MSDRQLEFVLRRPDGVVLLVSSIDYRKLQLTAEKDGARRGIPIIRLERFRDSGTVHIETSEGELYRPAPVRADLRLTWTPAGGSPERLDVLDPTTFSIGDGAEYGIPISQENPNT